MEDAGGGEGWRLRLVEEESNSRGMGSRMSRWWVLPAGSAQDGGSTVSGTGSGCSSQADPLSTSSHRLEPLLPLEVMPHAPAPSQVCGSSSGGLVKREPFPALGLGTGVPLPDVAAVWQR